MNTFIAALLLSTAFSTNALADEGECIFSELTDENIGTIAQSLAVKAMDKHLSKFKKGMEIVGKNINGNEDKSRKMPWALKNEDQLTEFFDDILRRKEQATRSDNGPVKLIVSSDEITDDRIKFWEDETGTLIVFDPNNGSCGTAHRPDNGYQGYESKN